MPATMTVGLITKPNSDEARKLVPELLAWLAGRGVAVRCDPETAGYAGGVGIERDQVPEGADLVVVLGGDGTLLSAARAIAGREIPLLAVNVGSLGFLTAITVEELYPELERALRGEHRIGLRRMLRCELWRGERRVARYDSLNDAVLTKVEMARMIELDTHVDDHFVCVYRADGLIVATPTGSTAYSLSAGGPIIFPSVGALCITPICPHTLTARPVIVSDESVITIVNRAQSGATYLTIDGQVGQTLDEGDRVVCRASEFSIHLVRPPKMRFFDVLRKKLQWGGQVP